MIPQLESENRKQMDQNLRKEAINWINPSKSRAQSFDCIDAVDYFDYIDSTRWYDSKNWNYINTIKSSKTIHVIGGRN